MSWIGGNTGISARAHPNTPLLYLHPNDHMPHITMLRPIMMLGYGSGQTHVTPPQSLDHNPSPRRSGPIGMLPLEGLFQALPCHLHGLYLTGSHQNVSLKGSQSQNIRT